MDHAILFASGSMFGFVLFAVIQTVTVFVKAKKQKYESECHTELYYVYQERQLILGGYGLSPVIELGAMRGKTFQEACEKLCKFKGYNYDVKTNTSDGLRLFQTYEEADKASLERYVPAECVDTDTIN